MKNQYEEPYHPVKANMVLFICEKRVNVPIDSFRLLVKDIYEYMEFRTLTFVYNYTDNEQEILFWDLFKKD